MQTIRNYHSYRSAHTNCSTKPYRLSLRNCFSISLLLAANIALVACADFEPHTYQTKSPHTGGSGPATDPDGNTENRPFVTLGGQDRLEKLKTEIASTSDKKLSSAIKKVTVTRLFHNSGTELKRLVKNLVSLKVIIEFQDFGYGTPNLEFNVPLKTQSKIPTADRVYHDVAARGKTAGTNKVDATNATTTGTGNVTGHHTTTNPTKHMFSLDTFCVEAECNKIELKLNRHEAADVSGANSPSYGPIVGTAGILVQNHDKARVRMVQRPLDLQDVELKKLEKPDPTRVVERTSYSVIDGRSATHVKVTEGAEGPAILEFDADGADTAKSEVVLKDVRLSNQVDIPARLVGINPENSSIAISVTSPGTNESALLIVDDEPLITPPSTSTQPSITKAPSDAAKLFPVDLDAAQLPQTYSTVQNFNSYATHPDVQRLVGAWLGEEVSPSVCGSPQKSASPKRLVNYISGMQNLTGILCKMGQLNDVNCEIGALLALESTYAVTPEYPTMEVGRDGDVGPWQMLPIAVEDVIRISGLPFKTFPLLANNTPNPSDHRVYFVNSAYMVNIRLKKDFAYFADDPAKAILAYNSGRKGATDILSQLLDRTNPANMTLSDIVSYRISTENAAVCPRLNYAFNFLAVRTIVQNLDKYRAKVNGEEIKLDAIPASSSEAYKKYLYLPGAPLPPGLEI